MSRKSRTKGAAFEREIARLFRKWWPMAHRGLQYHDGTYAPDVCLPPDYPLYIECKRYKKPVSNNQLNKWYLKAVNDCIDWLNRNPKQETPAVILIYKFDYKPAMVILNHNFDEVELTQYEGALDNHFLTTAHAGKEGGIATE